ncbi:hypothetical protein C4F49_05485 [Sphingobacterium sp. KB22]|uniref:Uncharacterized protein n=2 Tax=Sphingobacterium hungaricum TaxID=2082723 RepID=A0A928UUG0_9SPHI|nr:hypothetical protein [Sphingobacterium hungaricum]
MNSNMNLQSILNIVYLNKDGDNLLSDATIKRYDRNRIKLFYILHGEKTLVNNVWSKIPNGFLVVEDNPCRLEVLFNIGAKEDLVEIKDGVETGVSNTIIEINDTIIDKVKLEWEKSSTYLLITKAWYNGFLVYDVKNNINGLKGMDGFVVQR